MQRKTQRKTESRRSNTQQGSRSESENNDLQELFLDELADVHNAERQLTKALPKMAKAAESDELRQAFETHLEETLQHVSRLEEVAEKLNERIENKTCKAMEGLIKEAQELMKEQEDSSALDAALIAAAQKVEHYEIASYGTLRAWAEQLGHKEAIQLLEQTLTEEKAADTKLTTVAESVANQKARAE